MLGQSPGVGFQPNYQPQIFNEPSWLLAKYTSLSGSQKVNVEGNVRAVFSMHRRQLAVWNENVILICIDLHHSKSTIPTKDKYAIIKEKNVSLCRLKFRSLPDRVSFGAALAELVHVTNDKCESQEVSSQGWQSSGHGTSSSQPESVSSQGRSEPQGAVLEPDMEMLPRHSRASTPLSTIQLTPSDSSPWRCYFKGSVSPIPLSRHNESKFKIPTLDRSRMEKKRTLFEEENDENYHAEGYMEERGTISPIPIGDTLEESDISKSLNESMELFNDDHSRSRSDIGDTIPFNQEKWTGKKEDSIDLFEDYDDDNDDEQEPSVEEKKNAIERMDGEETGDDRTNEGEWGMTRSFIARLREIPEEKKLKDGEVIRVKGDRALMHGQDCPCCREYYDALGLDEGERQTRVNNVSRHRFVARGNPMGGGYNWNGNSPLNSFVPPYTPSSQPILGTSSGSHSWKMTPPSSQSSSQPFKNTPHEISSQTHSDVRMERKGWNSPLKRPAEHGRDAAAKKMKESPNSTWDTPFSSIYSDSDSLNDSFSSCSSQKSDFSSQPNSQVIIPSKTDAATECSVERSEMSTQTEFPPYPEGEEMSQLLNKLLDRPEFVSFVNNLSSSIDGDEELLAVLDANFTVDGVNEDEDGDKTQPLEEEEKEIADESGNESDQSDIIDL